MQSYLGGIVLTICAAMNISTAFGQDICARYVGQKVNPLSFDTAINGLSQISPKSEFETTAQYNQRRSTSMTGKNGPLIIKKELEDSKYLKYDADSSILAVQRYAFDNTSFSVWDVFYDSGYYGKIDFDSVSNVDVVISSTDKSTGSYQASNAYGAKAEIVKINRTLKAIFDKKGNISSYGLFPRADKEPYVVGNLKLTPDEARHMKQVANIAFVAIPKEPYLITGVHKIGEVTIRNPRDVTENFTILIADIQCGLLMDNTNLVLGSYPTR